jgi:hypothetical protein
MHMPGDASPVPQVKPGAEQALAPVSRVQQGSPLAPQVPPSEAQSPAAQNPPKAGAQDVPAATHWVVLPPAVVGTQQPPPLQRAPGQQTSSAPPQARQRVPPAPPWQEVPSWVQVLPAQQA